MIGASGAWRAGFTAAIAAPLRQQPGRVVLAVLGIALGVALGVAVHLINASALNEFNLAVHNLAGEADIVIRGPRAGFAEEVYPRVARRPEVAAASPAVELEVRLAGRRDTLKIVGLDPFRAADVQPALTGDISGAVLQLFDPHAILLSPAAAEALGVGAGDTLPVQVGTATIELKVIGLLAPESHRQRLAVMDIASAQWTLGRLGRLNRIDLRLKPGTDVAAFRTDLQRALPAGAQAVTPELEAERGATLTRAYRVNLDMLALVALLTGGFLVFATQYLALLRRRGQLALLRALGVTRRELVLLLLGEGAALGAVGAALGVALGVALATIGVEQLGGDLGAGYFRNLAPELSVKPAVLAAFFALGLAAALLGAFAPACETARRPPAVALKAGDEQVELRRPRIVPGMVLILVGAGLTLAPAVDGLPLFGYAAIAALLLGTILLMPHAAAFILNRLPTVRVVPAALAAAQLGGTPRQVAISTATIVASFSLMVAMLIMVTSFRLSLDHWLTRMLPADVYVRAAAGGETGFFTVAEQQRIAATRGVARVEFLRSQTLLLDPQRPPLVLLARPLQAAAIDRALPLTAPAIVPRADEPPPVWISEITADLYHWRAGDRVWLPISDRPLMFTVAGVWRDYARQTGAIAIDRDLYVQLTGDQLANDAAVWLATGASFAEVASRLRGSFDNAAAIEIVPAGEVRAASLKTFDRTFAITYALEAAAVLIGLFGVSVSFSAQALARRREFGMLRHIGMTRGQIGAMLATEGALVAAIGAAVGLALGWCQGLILIHVVNRQSFHWSMELAVPWLALAALTLVLLVAASMAALISGRGAMGDDVVLAVREDW